MNPTIEGVVRLPSLLGMTTGSPPSITATQELVVPKSIPITFAIFVPSSARLFGGCCERPFALGLLRRGLRSEARVRRSPRVRPLLRAPERVGPIGHAADSL